MKDGLSRAWLVVALLWPVALLNYLDRLMITTMREPILKEIAMSNARFGLLTSIFVWVYGFLSPLGGYLADRYGRRVVILGSLVVWSAVTWATGQASSFPELLLARGLMGISEACYIPAALALIADYHRGSTRSLATGLHTSGIYAGAALGGLGGVIAERFGWRAAFSLFGAIGLVYGIVLVFGLRDTTQAEDEGDSRDPAAGQGGRSLCKTLSELTAEPGFRILVALNLLVGACNWVIYTWLPTYLRDHFSLGVGAAGMSATGYVQIASFVGTLAGGAWADAWCRSRPGARAIVPAIGYLAAGPWLLLTATTAELPLAIAGLLAFGLGRGIFDANHMPLLRCLVPARASATGYGVLNLASCLAGGVMIYIGGALRDAHVSLALIFQAAAIGLTLSGALLLAIRIRAAPTIDVPAS